MKEGMSTTAKGIVQIFDITDERKELFYGCNDIHPQNMANIIAKALSNEAGGLIFEMALGSGGSHIDAAGNIVYLPPNTDGEGATLYQETYSAIINTDAAKLGCSVVSARSPLPDITSEIVCTLLLQSHEPTGQAITDSITSDPNAPYIFDELGLRSGDGHLLTHITFNPIEKTATRIFEIIYTIVVGVVGI